MLLCVLVLLSMSDGSRRRAHAVHRNELGVPDSNSSQGELVAGGAHGTSEEETNEHEEIGHPYGGYATPEADPKGLPTREGSGQSFNPKGCMYV